MFGPVLGFQLRIAEELPLVLRVRVTAMVLVMLPPVIVMVPLFVPTVAVAVLTLTVTVPLFEPEVGLAVSQLPFVLTVHDALDVTVNDWLAGLAAP